MANWYVSSVAYAAISAWAATTAYTVGQIIRPTAAVAGKKLAYRCTTAGTTAGTEPTWSATFGGTTTSSTAVFTTINADAYGWTGAAGDISSVTNVSTTSFATAGDKIFLSSDHAENTAASTTNWLSAIGGGWTTVTTDIISVNRGGSVPPVAGDITPGASITFQTLYLDTAKPIFFEGVTLAASAGSIQFNPSAYGTTYLKNCSLQITGSNSGYKITSGDYAEITLDNTSMSFAAAGQTVSMAYSVDLTWINTASPLAGTAPTYLFSATYATNVFTFRGVDFSSYTGNLVFVTTAQTNIKCLFDSCKISSSATVLLASSVSANGALVELVNCWDGTNVRNERYAAAGSVVTEHTITLTGGAADDVGSFSLKMVSGSSHIDKWVAPLPSFWFDVENTSIGVSHTATVEIVSSASLNNDDVWLQLEYMGTSGSQLASFANSLPATPLTANAAATASSEGWNSSPATPAYQHLQVTFTPQVAGRVRGRVMLGKASATVYINPNIVIT